MEIELVLSFIVASILLSVMPGPDNIFVLTESITKGHINGIAISVGLSLGVLIHTLAAAAGLSIIILKSAFIFSLIKYLGAIYLFYLVYLAIKEKKAVLNFGVNKTVEKVKILPLIKKGFLMNILNPKVSLFFVAFLPQFVSINGMNISLQMVILGIIFMVQAVIIFSLIAILSGQLTKYVNNSRFWKITKWTKVSVLSVLGLILIFSKN